MELGFGTRCAALAALLVLVGCGDSGGDVSPTPEADVALGQDAGTVGDVSSADDAALDVSDPMDVVADDAAGDTAGDVSGDSGDAGPHGRPELGWDQAREGALETADDRVEYRMTLSEGDVVRVTVTALDGDLQPSAYLYPGDAPGEDAEFVAPDTYALEARRVLLNYTAAVSGAHVLRVRPYNGGAGRYRVEALCVNGPCHAEDPDADRVRLRVIGINDFHGHLEPPFEDVGGAAWLAAHVDALREDVPHAMFVSAGDLLGASPFVSARYHDEPTIEAMNLAGLDLNAVGNHEFDEGFGEIERLRDGGCHPTEGCSPLGMFEGATFQTLGANVLDADGVPVLPSFTVRFIEDVPVAFIGMTLENTPSVTVPSQVEGLTFADEVETVDRVLPELDALGVEAIVVVVHQGGSQGGDANDCDALSGRIVAIAEALDPAVDVVLSGHTHTTYNCTLEGGRVLTSAGSSGRWMTRLDLILDRVTGDVEVANALNVRVDHERAPDPDVAALVARYRAEADQAANTVVGVLDAPLSRSGGPNGLSPLGVVIADSQLFATASSAGAQIALMNNGGIRASLDAGDVTFAEVFAVQPFENRLITLTLSGIQLRTLLRAQVSGSRFSILQASRTLAYTLIVEEGDARLDEASITVEGVPLDLNADYRVTVNAFLAEGGDGSTVLAEGSDRVVGPVDSDAFVDYLSASPSPLPSPTLDHVLVR